MLSHLICGSFIQPLAAGVADLPVSNELGKNIYSMYSEQRVHEDGGATDFIVPMQFVEVAFVCCRFTIVSMQLCLFILLG